VNTHDVERIVLETARMPDRDRLRAALAEAGFEVRDLDEDGMPSLEVLAQGRNDLLDRIEAWLADNDLPLVPVLADGRVLVRPPGE
jgi:uncharacterized protein Smg (DUF494 family)